jgi:Starch/carbohydrate-binding module (family 53)
MIMADFGFFFKNAGLHKLGNTRAYNEETSTEIYDKVYNTDSMPPYNSYTANGIEVTQAENPMKMSYTGMLAQSGAKEVYAVVGYGANDRWEDIETIKLRKSRGKKFVLELAVKRSGNINIAFKDEAENWDNNSGNNYTFANLGNQGLH